ncbi:MAG: hypothetical protein CM15mP55_3580 [Hyphomicrobiales bacterium]|nr:MAG: hypothetical protein CM15mP55_3580 [Hyphomicrobiales bacterium]
MRQVAEAAVVGYPHDIKGQGIYCYVTLNAGLVATMIEGRTCAMGRKEIGPIASPDLIQFARACRKHARQNHAAHFAKNRRRRFLNLGDTSTLADPSVVDDLIDNRQNRS